MECKYCQHLGPIDMCISSLIAYNSYFVDMRLVYKPQTDEYFLSAMGEHHSVDVKISYCPFCGRKLGE